MRQLGQTIFRDIADQMSGRRGDRQTRKSGLLGEPTGATREWQFGDTVDTAEVWVSERIAWQVERTHGRQGTFAPVEGSDAGDVVFATEYGVPRALLGWVDAVTKIAETGAPDDAFETLKAHFPMRIS